MRGRALLSRFGPWLLILVSVAGLITLILTAFPSPLMRLVFLGLLFLGTFGLTFLPLRAFYHRRRSADARRRDPQRPLREAIILAGFMTFCAWLRMLRILTLTNALLLLGVLIFMEAFWVSRLE